MHSSTIDEKTKIKTNLTAIYWLLSIAIGASCVCTAWTVAMTFRMGSAEAKIVEQNALQAKDDKDQIDHREQMASDISEIKSRVSNMEGYVKAIYERGK